MQASVTPMQRVESAYCTVGVNVAVLLYPQMIVERFSADFD
ncbi:MAG: hypothetical protein ACI9WS_002129 [Paraglaciecola psychrophila]|jgi:hypothetical protein